MYGNDGGKQDKFVLTAPQDQLKCVVTLTGDHISQAVIFHSLWYSSFVLNGFLIASIQDISFKVQRAQNIIQRTAITPESPWKLQQIQDAANHLQQAIHHIDDVDSTYQFK